MSGIEMGSWNKADEEACCK